MMLMSESGEVVVGIVGILFFVGMCALLIWAVNRAISGISRPSSDELLSAVLTIGGIWLASKALGRGFAFLKGMDWTALGEDLQKAIEEASREVDSAANGIARLNKAQELLAAGNEIEKDAAAMLASATLELGLRALAKRHALALSPEEDSLVGLAIRLGKEGIITHREREDIRHYAMAVRNRVMHGETGFIDSQEVLALINFARGVFAAHRLA